MTTAALRMAAPPPRNVRIPRNEPTRCDGISRPTMSMKITCAAPRQMQAAR